MQTIQFLRHDGVFRKTVSHAWELGALKTICGRIVPPVLYRSERDADCFQCLKRLAGKSRKVPRKSSHEITEEQVKAAVRAFRNDGGIIQQHKIDPRLNELGRIGRVMMMHPQNRTGK